MQPQRTFHAPRGPLGFLAFVSLVLLGMGGWAVTFLPLLGVPLLLFGTAVFVLSMGSLRRGVTYLRLDNEGFETASFRYSRKTKWHDVKSFRIAPYNRRDSSSSVYVIAFDYHPTCIMKEKTSALASRMMGYDGCIAGTYGMPPETLLKEMNAWLARYGKPGR